jgi:hypothetical protein
MKVPALTNYQRSVILDGAPYVAPPSMREQLGDALRRRAAIRRAEAAERRPARPLPIKDALHYV